MKDILLYLLASLVGVYAFGKIRKWILKRGVDVIMNKDKPETGSYVGNSYNPDGTLAKKNGREIFQPKKFKKNFQLFNGIEWLKTLSTFFNIRTLLMISLILGSMYGFGYWKGLGQTPAMIDVGYGRVVHMQMENNRYLHIDDKGLVTLQDKKGRVLRTIKVKDVPGLNRLLSPYALQLKPIIVAGMGTGTGYRRNTGAEVGAGVSVFRAWKMQLDLFLTNRGVYVGTSYKLTKKGNLSVGIAGGHGYSRDDLRALLYVAFKF